MERYFEINVKEEEFQKYIFVCVDYIYIYIGIDLQYRLKGVGKSSSDPQGRNGQA